MSPETTMLAKLILYSLSTLFGTALAYILAKFMVGAANAYRHVTNTASLAQSRVLADDSQKKLNQQATSLPH